MRIPPFPLWIRISSAASPVADRRVQHQYPLGFCELDAWGREVVGIFYHYRYHRPHRTMLLNWDGVIHATLFSFILAIKTPPERGRSASVILALLVSPLAVARMHPPPPPPG